MSAAELEVESTSGVAQLMVAGPDVAPAINSPCGPELIIPPGCLRGVRASSGTMVLCSYREHVRHGRGREEGV